MYIRQLKKLTAGVVYHPTKRETLIAGILTKSRIWLGVNGWGVCQTHSPYSFRLLFDIANEFAADFSGWR